MKSDDKNPMTPNENEKLRKAEKLSESLLGVDEKYIAEALSSEKAGAPVAFRKKGAMATSWRRAVIIAACITLALALALGGALTVPHLFPDGDTNAPTDSVGEMFPETATVINSLDKLNYYGGKRVISAGRRVSDLPMPIEKSSKSPVGASETSEDDLIHETDDGNMGAKPIVGSEDISSCTFKITTAINYFINVTEKDIFLAKKVGTGRVEVMITDLCIDVNGYAMITFKNGEQFFSCLTESYALRDGENNFGTHLYIEDFSFYKDLRDGVSTFKVIYDEENRSVPEMAWIPYNRVPKDAPVYSIDIIEDSVVVSHSEYIFTLSELQEYYFGIEAETNSSDDGDSYGDNNTQTDINTDEETVAQQPDGVETTTNEGVEDEHG